jgi:RNA polymerase sigma-19 factor, ECF subfamily
MKPKITPATTLAAAVHEKFRAQLYQFLVRRLRGEQGADDLAQEVYLRLLRMEKSELVRQPQAYVYTIASHVASQFRMREEQSLVKFDSEALQQAAEDPEHVLPDELAEQLSTERLVEMMLQDLPAMHRAVLVLCKRDGMSWDEAAEKLGISVHTVKKYLYEAKARIAAAQWER